MVPANRSAERRYASYNYGHADENLSRRQQRRAHSAAGAPSTPEVEQAVDGQPSTKQDRPATPEGGTAQGGETARPKGSSAATARDQVGDAGTTGKAGSGNALVQGAAPGKGSSGAANPRSSSQPAGKDQRAAQSGALAVPPRD